MFDLWGIISQWNRRRVYRDAVAEGGNPFKGRLSKKIRAKEVKTEAQKQAEEEKVSIKYKIISLINQGNIASAADLYLENKDDSASILPKQALLDIANQLMSASKWAPAAEAYEKFLSLYGSYEYSEQVRLMLGITYSRYLENKEKALEHLKKAAGKLSDAGQKKMCAEEIRRLEG
jgi:tetratricopeptide (TPR) repeat protein